MKFYSTKEETIKVLEEEAKSYLYQLDDEECINILKGVSEKGKFYIETWKSKGYHINIWIEPITNKEYSISIDNNSFWNTFPNDPFDQ